MIISITQEETIKLDQTELIFRKANASDQDAIKSLIKEVDINPLGIKWQRFLLVVDEEDQLIGCGQIKPHKDGSRELASIAVQRAWRNQGVAKAIIDKLIAEATPPIWLTCRHKLTVFYEPFGFREVEDLSTMPPYFKRVARLFQFLQWISRTDMKLAVMVWR